MDKVEENDKISKYNYTLDLSKFTSGIEEVKNFNTNIQESLTIGSNTMISPEDNLFYVPNYISNLKTVFHDYPPLLNLNLFNQFEESTLMFIYYYYKNTAARETSAKIMMSRGWIYSEYYGLWLVPIRPLTVETEDCWEGKFKCWDNIDWNFKIKKGIKIDPRIKSK